MTDPNEPADSGKDLSWAWVWIASMLSVAGLVFLAAFALGWGPGIWVFAACAGVSLFFRGLSWRSRRQMAKTGPSHIYVGQFVDRRPKGGA